MLADQKKFLRAHASPSIRKFARELGVDLSQVQGTGRKGRITQQDVQVFVKQVLAGASPAGATAAGAGIPEMPEIDFSKFGSVEIQPLSRIKKKTGVNLHRAWLNVPIVTHHDEADVTELENFRKSLSDEAKKQDVKLTLLSFLLKACAAAIRKHPTFNSSLTADKENLVIKHYLNIGVAVDTPDGLVVPVIRDVEQKGLLELAKELAEVSTRARTNKLKSSDIEGGCFSISSLGGIGGTAFTPLVNAPEVAVLGVTRSRMVPVWDGKDFNPRLMLPLDLTYDHRVIDGAQAARFMVDLCAILGDMRRMSI
jgi:pyruvate dehydrogenase E2 component (dihydrolipoamide acetyltransferase)